MCNNTWSRTLRHLNFCKPIWYPKTVNEFFHPHHFTHFSWLETSKLWFTTIVYEDRIIDAHQFKFKDFNFYLISDILSASLELLFDFNQWQASTFWESTFTFIFSKICKAVPSSLLSTVNQIFPDIHFWNTAQYSAVFIPVWLSASSLFQWLT